MGHIILGASTSAGSTDDPFSHDSEQSVSPDLVPKEPIPPYNGKQPILDYFLELAPNERPDLEDVIDLIKKSIKHYIPFTYEKTNNLFPKEFISDEKYDVFFAKISKYMGIGSHRYITVTIKNKKAFVCECTESENGLLKKYELSLNLTEKTNKNFISLMENFKSLNKISEKISDGQMADVFQALHSADFFRATEQMETIHLYGLNSHLFGISFGGHLLHDHYKKDKETNNYTYAVSSLFLSYGAYMTNIRKGYVDRDDNSINEYFNTAINKIEFKNTAAHSSVKQTQEN